MTYHALVPAAGSGARMGVQAQPMRKQYLPLVGQPMIRHALATLCATPAIANVFVVLAPDDEFWPAAEMAALGSKVRVLRCGGSSGGGQRQFEAVGDPFETVFNSNSGHGLFLEQGGE